MQHQALADGLWFRARQQPCDQLNCYDVSGAIMPQIVNSVAMVELLPEGETFDLRALAERLPNAKCIPRRYSTLSIKLDRILVMVFGRGLMIVLKACGHEHARYYAQLVRTLLSDVSGGRELSFANWKVYNLVGNGSVVQDGVHLSNLLHHQEDRCKYDPSNYTNLHYKGVFPNGQKFSANITDGAKINIMGVRTWKQLFDAFEYVKRLISHFEDPNAPTDSKQRLAYRLEQLVKHSGFQLGKRKKAATAKKRKRPIAKKKKDEEDEEDAAEDEEEDEGLMSTLLKDVLPCQTTKAATTTVAEGDEPEYSLLMDACRTRQVGNIRWMIGHGLVLSDSPDVEAALEYLRPSRHATDIEIAALLKSVK